MVLPNIIPLSSPPSPLPFRVTFFQSPVRKQTSGFKLRSLLHLDLRFMQGKKKMGLFSFFYIQTAN